MMFTNCLGNFNIKKIIIGAYFDSAFVKDPELKMTMKELDMRVRKVNMTDRDRLGEQVIPDKKKVENKKKCRKFVRDYND